MKDKKSHLMQKSGFRQASLGWLLCAWCRPQTGQLLETALHTHTHSTKLGVKYLFPFLDDTGKEWCKHCSTQFDKVQTHFEVYHPSDNSHYCYVCSKESSSVYNTIRQLQAHLRYHK